MRRNKALWILLFLGVAAYIALGLSRISFNVDILRLLPSQLHQVEGLALFLKNFALPNELIITVKASDAETADSSVERISESLSNNPGLVARVVDAPPWEKNPATLAEFLSFLLINQSSEKTDALLASIGPAHAEGTLKTTLQDLTDLISPRDMAVLSWDPYQLSTSLMQNSALCSSQRSAFSSSDGRFRVVYVESPKTFSNYKETAEWIKKIREVTAASVLGMDVSLGFTGEPAFVAEISTGMQWDMVTSAVTTLALITFLFWICYRAISPLRWLLLLLQLIFLISLATAGLFLNQLTAIGAGFASVMIGLSVDYGYFIYQQSLRHSGNVRELQWKCLRNILLTSSTTAAAFFSLNLSSLPGLSQLGNMVGIGVCVGVIVMLGVFTPLCIKFRSSGRPQPSLRGHHLFSSSQFIKFGELIAVVMVIICLGALILKGFPHTDFSLSALRPKNSQSHQALEQLSNHLGVQKGELNLVITGRDATEVLIRLQKTQQLLEEAKKDGKIRSFISPLGLWPDSANQQRNLLSLGSLEKDLPRLKNSLLKAGFKEEAFSFTSDVLGQIAKWHTMTPPIWPSNPTSQWILQRLALHTNGNFMALGIVDPVTGFERSLVEEISSDGVYLVSWENLSKELEQLLPKEIMLVSLGLISGILVILAFGLRSLKSVCLFIVTTLLVLLCLAGAMSLLGMTWGLLNLAAVLLLLGTGTDYSILLLLALRRNGGDISAAHKDLGLVIFLCCTSAAIGFGSLAWASNLGLAALGKTCSLGLLIDGVISLFLLPRVWRWLFPEKKA
jgi:predicted exporter